VSFNNIAVGQVIKIKPITVLIAEGWEVVEDAYDDDGRISHPKYDGYFGLVNSMNRASGQIFIVEDINSWLENTFTIEDTSHHFHFSMAYSEINIESIYKEF